MDKGDFKRWRKSLELSQKEAAQLLGLKRRVVQYYENGERDGKKVEIPVSVRLACWAIAQGQRDYAGPAKRKEKPAETASPAPRPKSDEVGATPDDAPAKSTARKRRSPPGAKTASRTRPAPKAPIES